MILMKIEGVEGDCQIPGFSKHFTLNSASFNITRDVADSAKAGTQDIVFGVGQLEDLSIGKSMDKGSPELAKYAMRGSTLGTVDIKFVETTTKKGGSDPVNFIFLWIKLDKAFAKTWGINGSEDGRPEEELTLWYNKIAFRWYYLDNDGSPKSSSDFLWDHVKNREWSGGDAKLPDADKAYIEDK